MDIVRKQDGTMDQPGGVGVPDYREGTMTNVVNIFPGHLAVNHQGHTMQARPMGIDTYQELVAYMRSDCLICRSEGFESQSRIRVETPNGNVIIATLNVVHTDALAPGEVGFSDMAWRMLGIEEQTPIELSHPEPVDTFRHVRKKLFNHRLSSDEIQRIVADIAGRRYSDIQLSAFLTACSAGRMDPVETVALTRAMAQTGEQLSWPYGVVMDKHCVGGLPGNRTTPIVTAIVTACGVVMPKTSSRAITSPAGTTDVMETLTTVDLTIDEMRRVVDQEGGCIVWGGSVQLSPADDILIRVERALDIDSEAQLVASIMSKKLAAGSTHVVIDIPVGPTAKIRGPATAAHLSDLLSNVGMHIGLQVSVIMTDGTQPVGQGIGPALEARDVLAVLQNEPSAPADLRQRAILLAGHILEITGTAPPGEGRWRALRVLRTGQAWNKFRAICNAQGGLRTPPVAEHQWVIQSASAGTVQGFDNRRLAKIAKLAGAPNAPAAGIDLHVKTGDVLAPGAPLLTVHAQSSGELNYALNYMQSAGQVIRMEESS